MREPLNMFSQFLPKGTAPFGARSSRQRAKVKPEDEVAAFLNSLKYSNMNERANDVLRVVPNSYRWIFASELEADQSTSTWDNFPVWLKSNRARYWVQGHAGSGKSTLMKFLWHDQRTTDLLTNMHQQRTPLKLAHFFWLAENNLQNNRKGLICSLLHQILTKDKERAYTMLEAHPALRLKRVVHDWAVLDLIALLEGEMRTWASQGPICIFLDGLDEFRYDQSPQELFELLNRFTSIPGVKICMSSRPEQIFITHLGRLPQLKLQELTRTDIAQFVSTQIDAFEKHDDKYRLLITARAPIIADLTNGADGIFLWVRLALNEVHRGLTVCTTSSELQNWTQAIPRSVKALYKAMLQRSEDDYEQLSEEASLYFRMYLLWQSEIIGTPTESWAYRLPDTAYCNILVYAHLRNTRSGQGVLQQVDSFMDYGATLRQCQSTMKRIRVACAGMFEVSPELDETERSQATADTDCKKRLAFLCRNVKIRPIHRTVLDFLVDTPDGKEILERCTLDDKTMFISMMQGLLLTFRLSRHCVELYGLVEDIGYWDLSDDERLLRLTGLMAAYALDTGDASDMHNGLDMSGCFDSDVMSMMHEIQTEFKSALNRRDPIAEGFRSQDDSTKQWFVWPRSPLGEYVVDFTGFSICHGVFEHLEGRDGFMGHLARDGLQPSREYLSHLLLLVVMYISDDVKPYGNDRLDRLWLERMGKILSQLIQLGAEPNTTMCLHASQPWKFSPWTVFACNIATRMMNEQKPWMETEYWSVCRHVYLELLHAGADPDASFVVAWRGTPFSDDKTWGRPERVRRTRSTVFFEFSSRQVIEKAFDHIPPENTSAGSQAQMHILSQARILLVGEMDGMAQPSDVQRQDLLSLFKLDAMAGQPRGLANELQYRSVVKPLLDQRLSELWDEGRAHWGRDPPVWERAALRLKFQLQLFRDQKFLQQLQKAEIGIDFVLARIARSPDKSLSNVLKLMNGSNRVNLNDFLIQRGFMGTSSDRLLPRMAAAREIDDDIPVSQAVYETRRLLLSKQKDDVC